jgi:hypothetical protein
MCVGRPLANSGSTSVGCWPSPYQHRRQIMTTNLLLRERPLFPWRDFAAKGKLIED